MSGGDVAARRQGVDEGANYLPWLVLIRDEVQDRDQQQRNRLAEVDDLAN